MDFIATHWWVWLITLILSGGYALNFQLKKIKSMKKNVMDFDINSASKTVFDGLGKMAIAGLVSSASSILLAISIIIHLINYYKHP